MGDNKRLYEKPKTAIRENVKLWPLKKFMNKIEKYRILRNTLRKRKISRYFIVHLLKDIISFPT